MKNVSVLVIITVLWCLTTIPAAAVEIAPRITDREIIETLSDIRGDIKGLNEKVCRLEDGQKAILREMDKRFDSIENQMQNLVNIFIGIVVAFAGIVAITIGFAIWDRRTALRPTLREISEVREKENKIINALTQFAKSEPRMAEVLRSFGLL